MEGVGKSPTDTYPMRTLEVSESIFAKSMVHAVTILACWLLRPSDVDAYAVWVVVCHNPDNALHPFVVWNAIDRPEGWCMEGGDYCSTISEAVKRYESRGGRYSLDD